MFIETLFLNMTHNADGYRHGRDYGLITLLSATMPGRKGEHRTALVARLDRLAKVIACILLISKTNIMNLELKHLAPYLPYGLKIESQKGTGDLDYKGLKKEMTCFNCHKIDGDKWKPILLPLSALTEQLPDGTIPIVGLAKIATKHIWGELIDFTKAELLSESESAGLIVYYDKTERVSFTADFDCNRKDFTLYSDGDELNMDKLQLFEYLFQNHFDVFGLIDQNLAVPLI